MGSSSKRAPARSPHALGGASTLGNQPLAQQYQQHQPYQPYKPYQPCQQDTEQPQPQQQQEESKERGGIYSWQAQVKEEDPYDGYADYDSRCSQNPVSFGLQVSATLFFYKQTSPKYFYSSFYFHLKPVSANLLTISIGDASFLLWRILVPAVNSW